MTTRGVTLTALLSALSRPSWWILGLAGFLVRGGIVLFVVAIVTLPSPLALSNLLGPLITPLYLGHLEPTTVALLGIGLATIVSWIIGGAWIAAATEVVLVRDAQRAASEQGLPTRPVESAGRMLIARSAMAHLLALLPTALVLVLESGPIFGVTYRELVNPSDASPIVLRVIAGAAGPMVLIVVAWVLGELVGGMAVRRLVLGGESVPGAVLRSAIGLVRRPGGALIAPLVTTIVLIVDLGAVLAVVMLLWSGLRIRLVHPVDEPLLTGLALLTFGAAWCLALLVTGFIDAWRSAAMTFEAERTAGIGLRSAATRDGGSQPGSSSTGTIGASAPRRPGDWSADDRGGSL